MAKKKTKTERRDSALKGWKTRRKNEIKNDGKNRKLARKSVAKKEKAKNSKNNKSKKEKAIKRSVKKHEPKRQPNKKQSKASAKKSTVKKPTRRKTKSAGKATPKRRARTAKRIAKTAKKKKAKKSTKLIHRKSSKTRKIPKRNKIVPISEKSKTGNRTYFVTVRLASGKNERKRPLNLIVWARDGLKDQEVIELLWAMIERRRDKNLIFTLDMEVRELIIAHGPLTDRLQGYRQN